MPAIGNTHHSSATSCRDASNVPVTEKTLELQEIKGVKNSCHSMTSLYSQHSITEADNTSPLSINDQNTKKRKNTDLSAATNFKFIKLSVGETKKLQSPSENSAVHNKENRCISDSSTETLSRRETLSCAQSINKIPDFEHMTTYCPHYELLHSLTKDIPPSLKSITEGETRQWKHPVTGDSLTIARVRIHDVHAVVALKKAAGENGVWRVIDPETGCQICNKVDFDTFNRYVHRDDGGLAGGGKNKKSSHSGNATKVTQTNAPIASASSVAIHRPVLREYSLPPPEAPGFFQSAAIHQVGEGALAETNKRLKVNNQINKDELLQTINKKMQIALPVDTEITYKGCATVIQVQRWIASTLLMLNSGRSDERQQTPEIQSGLVGTELIIGSNAQDDSHMITMLTDFFQKRFNPPPVKITGDKIANIKYLQQARHSEKLYGFVTNDAEFKTFLRNATRGCDTTEIEQTTFFLKNLRTALKNENQNIKIAPLPVGSAGGVHAEKRVIEYIQANQKKLYTEYMGTLQQDKPVIPMPVYLSGSKPPCGLCDAVEKYRHASSPQNGAHLVKIVRYEDPTTDPLQHSVGNIFHGSYAQANEDFPVHFERFIENYYASDSDTNTPGNNSEFNPPNNSMMFSRFNSVQ